MRRSVQKEEQYWEYRAELLNNVMDNLEYIRSLAAAPTEADLDRLGTKQALSMIYQALERELRLLDRSIEALTYHMDPDPED